MAFVLTPRFAPAYASCSPFGCAPAPQRVVYRQSRPSFPSFVPFLSQVDELLSQLDYEARRRAAHQARQQRKRAFRAKFHVNENEQGWEVQGEVPGFVQENIQIEVSDEQTLKISGNTEHRIEREAAPSPAPVEAAPEAEKAAAAEDSEMDGVTITEADLQEPERAASPAASDAGSHKSHQATVEDDFEDLGAETSSTVSAASEPKEPKGKERAVEEPVAVQSAPQPEAPAEQQQEQEEERFHGSFEQTFKFPVRIDASNVRASLKDGVLSVSVPKAPVHQVRQIAIQ